MVDIILIHVCFRDLNFNAGHGSLQTTILFGENIKMPVVICKYIYFKSSQIKIIPSEPVVICKYIYYKST